MSSQIMTGSDALGGSLVPESQWRKRIVQLMLHFVPEDSSAIWVSCSFSLLRYLQLLPIIYLPQFQTYWSSDQWFNGFNSIFDYIHYSRLARRASWSTFFVVFWLNAALIIIFLAVTLMVLMRVSQNKTVPRWVKLALKLSIKFLIGIFFYANLDGLFMISECTSVNGQLVMYHYQTVKCFEGAHLVSTIISYLLILPYTAVALLSVYLNFEPLLRKGMPHHR